MINISYRIVKFFGGKKIEIDFVLMDVKCWDVVYCIIVYISLIYWILWFLSFVLKNKVNI